MSSCPEVWSSPPAEGVPPFRFAFSPSVLSRVVESLENLRHLGAEATCPFVPSSRLVDWSQETVRAFTEHFEPRAASLAQEVKKYLSPYQFPLEAGEMPEDVRTLLDQGYKTVIRLPIDGGRSGKTEDALQSIFDQFNDIDSDAMIFLLHLRTLTLVIDGKPHTFSRRPSSKQTALDELTHYERIEVHEEPSAEGKRTPRAFHLWQQSIGTGRDAAGKEEIREAVRHLPNRWPEVTSATVGIATEEADAPAQGRFVIFLPTTVVTGTGAFINAPFFGSLDRRSINFADKYNKLLWRYVVRLTLRIIRGLASTLKNPLRAQVIADVAGSTAPVPGLGKRVLDELLAASLEDGPALAEEATVLCRSGWTEARKARALFAVPEASSVRTAVWKDYAKFPVLDDALLSRLDRVSALSTACGGTLAPSDAEIAATVGAPRGGGAGAGGAGFLAGFSRIRR